MPVLADLPPFPPGAVPVTTECVAYAARRARLPVSVLAMVLRTEGGRVGQIRRNRNGTMDYGPMQINDMRIEDLRRAGLKVNVTRLRWDGCYNVAVGARILADEIHRITRERPGLSWKARVWGAIGRYHSRTPKHARKYLTRVATSAARLTGKSAWSRFLDRINSGVLSWKRNRGRF